MGNRWRRCGFFLTRVLQADVILVVDRGAVVERGTHDELTEAGGVYSRLCKILMQERRSGHADTAFAF